MLIVSQSSQKKINLKKQTKEGKALGDNALDHSNSNN